MKRIRGIIESTTEPITTDCIWIKGNEARYFTNGEWVYIGESSEGREELEKKVDELDKEVGSMSTKVNNSIESLASGHAGGSVAIYGNRTAGSGGPAPALTVLPLTASFNETGDGLAKPGIMSASDKNILGATGEANITDCGDNFIGTFTRTGTYRVYGERTNAKDGLPIINSNPGHTVEGILKVLNSGISGSGQSTDKVVTQVLTMSNRTGADGHIWIRTGQGASDQSLTWSTWEKLQGIFEKNIITTDPLEALNSFTTNGMYSGIFVQPFSVSVYNGTYTINTASQFLVITNNGYALASPEIGGQTPVIMQMIFLVYNGKHNIFQRSGAWNGTSWEYKMFQETSHFSINEDGTMRLINKEGILSSTIGAGTITGGDSYLGTLSRIDDRLKFTYSDGILTITAGDGKSTTLTLE